jgi:uncharacterized membrane protein YphA (DoxX/SURF4 family)
MTLAMWMLRVFLGSLFLVSALRKIRERDQFDSVVFLLTGILRRWYKPMGNVVLVAEAITGASLILGFAPVISLLAALILMLLFDVVLIILFIGHPGLACGCFGSRSKEGVQRIDLVRNALITVSFIGLLAWQHLALPTRHIEANIAVLILVLVSLAVWEYWLAGRRSKQPRAGTLNA